MTNVHIKWYYDILLIESCPSNFFINKEKNDKTRQSKGNK